MKFLKAIAKELRYSTNRQVTKGELFNIYCKSYKSEKISFARLEAILNKGNLLYQNDDFEDDLKTLTSNDWLWGNTPEILFLTKKALAVLERNEKNQRELLLLSILIATMATIFLYSIS